MKQIGLVIAVLGWILSPTVLWIGIWPWVIVCVALTLLNGWWIRDWWRVTQKERQFLERLEEGFPATPQSGSWILPVSTSGNVPRPSGSSGVNPAIDPTPLGQVLMVSLK